MTTSDRDRGVRHRRAIVVLALLVTVAVASVIARTASAAGPAAGAGPVAAQGAAQAEPARVPDAEVGNADFEAQPVGQGVVSYGSPDGWSGGFAVENPDGDTYSALAVAATTGTMSGPNVLSLVNVPGQSVAQTTPTTILPGVTYTLTVAVGDRDNADLFGGSVLGLTSAGVPVATSTASVPPVQGSFGDVSLSWTATAADAGRPLGVLLGQAPGGGASSYADFDNVRLSAAGPAQAPTELVVVSPSAHQVLQRGATGTAAVPVRAVAPAGERLQARLVLRLGSRGRGTDWNALAADPVEGGFSGELPAVRPGWYDLQVRVLNADGALVTSRTVSRVGVGEVFITAGQSNSANHGGQPQRPGSDQVSSPTLGFGGWQQAADPQPNATGLLGSPWPAFGDRMAADTGLPVGIVAVGYAGTQIVQWQPGGTLYSRLQLAIRSLGPHGFRAVLWHQGESDARVCTTTRRYGAGLERLIATARQDAGFEVPWGIATVSTLPVNRPRCELMVTAAQAQVLRRTAGTFPGPSTDGYRAAGWTWDQVHFSEAGLRRHGEAWADAVERAGLLPTG